MRRSCERATHHGRLVRVCGALRRGGRAANLRGFRGASAFREQARQARWSGEAAWIPLGDLDLGLGFENHTSFPAPGEILLYSGGYSETEILFPYGGTRFASIVGQLAGNHFLTITEGREHLRELGQLVLWEGAQDIVFERT